LASAAPAGINQEYRLQARQVQALSFAVRIPLVCFGIVSPALVLFVEWLYLRTGDDLYRTLAQRWTKVMAALFGAGVVIGTILSFEMGLLWPSFTASFGSIFGLGFGIEGLAYPSVQPAVDSSSHSLGTCAASMGREMRCESADRVP
jgi:cytochrome bd ubiquinol oxidase subunit I